jgi:hypothetical protein
MHTKTILTALFCSLSLTYAWVFLQTEAPDIFDGSQLSALVLQTPQKQPLWKVLEVDDVASGATVPAGTNVIFHLPPEIKTITRDVLFGLKNDDIRYWGYCFPDQYDPNNPPQTVGFPGKMFLSYAERQYRATHNRPVYSIYSPPQKNINMQSISSDLIHHQIDVFHGGMTCYVMTSQPLAIGTDMDNDGLNIEVEKHLGTDPNNPDTDGDGILDGIEATTGTDPLRRDTDGDGIIDGVEDANQNGRVDPGETDPRKWDTDGDGLCDGYCRVFKTQRLCNDLNRNSCIDLPYGQWRGEDKNLNGIVDGNETDPRKWSTAGDGISDQQHYYNCLLQNKNNC